MIERDAAATLKAYVETLESLAETLPGEAESRRASVPGIEAALKALEDVADGTSDPHPIITCEQEDCGEEFVYCDAGNHFCPSCGESGEA